MVETQKIPIKEEKSRKYFDKILPKIDSISIHDASIPSLRNHYTIKLPKVIVGLLYITGPYHNNLSF